MTVSENVYGQNQPGDKQGIREGWEGSETGLHSKSKSNINTYIEQSRTFELSPDYPFFMPLWVFFIFLLLLLFLPGYVSYLKCFFLL